ncbi:MAG: hypothetical protein WAO21_11370 [Verrucomicrobiia bacterium]
MKKIDPENIDWAFIVEEVTDSEDVIRHGLSVGVDMGTEQHVEPAPAF